MASTTVQIVTSLGFFLVLVLASEAAVIREGSGAEELPPNIPDLFGKDKNLRKVPPFGDPALAGEEFDIYDDGVNNPGGLFPVGLPPDYDYKDPIDSDYDAGRDNWNREKKPAKKPGINRDDRPLKEKGGEEGDRDKNNDELDIDNVTPKPYDEERKAGEIPKKYDEEDEEVEVPKKDGGEDLEGGDDEADAADEDMEKSDAEEEEDKSLAEDKDSKVPEDVGVDESAIDKEETDEGEEAPAEDDKDDGEPGLVPDGSIFDTPFFNTRQVSKYFQQLEKALEHVFRQSMEEAALLNGTYANTTEEEVEINGKKYVVEKSIIKGKDNASSIYIETLSTKPKDNNTQEAKDSGL